MKIAIYGHTLPDVLIYLVTLFCLLDLYLYLDLSTLGNPSLDMAGGDWTVEENGPPCDQRCDLGGIYPKAMPNSNRKIRDDDYDCGDSW